VDDSIKDTLSALIDAHKGIAANASPNDDYRGEKFTHLIAGGEKRTIKTLFAIVYGAKIIKPEWVYACVEKGEFVPEDDYICYKYQAQIEKTKKAKLFNGITFSIAGSIVPKPSIVTSMILALGGKMSQSPRVCGVCIAGFGAPKSCIDVGHETVRESWLFDTVGAVEQQDFTKYTITEEDCKKWIPKIEKKEESNDDYEAVGDNHSDDDDFMDDEKETQKKKKIQKGCKKEAKVR